MLTEQQILANADAWCAYEMSKGLSQAAMPVVQKNKLTKRVLAEVRIVLKSDDEAAMDAVLAAMRAGKVEPIVRLTEEQLEEIEFSRWGE